MGVTCGAAWWTAAAYASYSGLIATTIGPPAVAYTATAGIYTAVASMSFGGAACVGGTVVTLGQGVGAITAADAEKKLNFTATHQDIMNRIPYEDTLVHENHILYVGDFVANKPHGEGQLF